MYLDKCVGVGVCMCETNLVFVRISNSVSIKTKTDRVHEM